MTVRPGERLALSQAQYGIWLGQQLDPENPAYWTAEAVELRGKLDEAAFGLAVRRAVDETDALHMRFVESLGEVWQTRDPSAGWELTRVDLTDAAEPRAAADCWMARALTVPAELARGPLFGTALLRLSAERHLWFLRAHHVALDGYGYHLLIRRVGTLYAALTRGAAALPPCSLGLAAVLEEERAYRASPALARDREFWCTRLGDAPAPGLLAPAQPIARSVLRRRGLWASESHARLRAAAAHARMDWTAWFLAGVGAWLARELGSEQTLGLPVTARLGAASLRVPCMAMNIVPLRVAPAPGESFVELARRVAAELRALKPHQRYRYEDLRHDLGCARRGRRLFGAVVNLMPFEPPREFGGLEAVTHAVSAGPVEDLAIGLASRAGVWQLDLEANPHAYAAEQLELQRAGLLDALELFCEEPQRPVLPAQVGAPALRETASLDRAAQACLVGEPLAQPVVDVLARIVAAAERAPEQIAIEQEGTPSLSYAELLGAVGALAARLRAAGVAPGVRVAILLPRTAQAVIAQLAVLWAGGAYVPLDPDGPPGRVASVLADAQPALLLTASRYARPLDAVCPRLLLDEPFAAPVAMPQAAFVPATCAAYVIYTSGSTGRPNGVSISRGALSHFVGAAEQRYAMSAADRVLQFAPLPFDASVEEIMLTLASGATLVLRTDAMLESFATFVGTCARLAISVLDLPTAFWHELTLALGDGLRLPDSVRLTIIGGEAALAERVARFRRSVSAGVVLLNTYGPTEATVVCCAAELAGEGGPRELGAPVPIGRPLPGIELRVLDAQLRPVRPGEPGELCVSGPTLASAYLGNAELTRERFVVLAQLPHAPRAYRTGDRVSLGPDGQLYYLGRLDAELKISGHRVHPLEVESALLMLPQIAEAAVVCQESADGGKRLCAFFVPRGPAPSSDELRAALGERLLPAALPGVFVALERLPRDANGKIDRKSLSVRDVEEVSVPVPQPSPLERVIMEVWREVLGRPVSSPMADFFALGGRSLSALQVVHRLGRALDRELALSTLFRHSSVAALARALTDEPAQLAREHPLAPLITLQPGSGPGLFCVNPAGGLAWCYAGLARHLPGRSLYGLQELGLLGSSPDSFDALLQSYLALIRRAQPRGPYQLLGWSSGGGIAHALAAALQASGERVALLALLDSYPADIWQGTPEPTEQDALVAMLDDLDASPYGADGQRLSSEVLFARLKRPGGSLASFDDATLWRMCRATHHAMRLYRTARHPRFAGELLFFRAAVRPHGAPDLERWDPYVAGRIECVDLPCHHLGMCQPAALEEIGQLLAARLAPAQ